MKPSFAWVRALRTSRTATTCSVTDNGNYIVDLHFKEPIKDVNKAASDLKNTVGVVDHGFVRWDELPSHRGWVGWDSRGWHGRRESLVVISSRLG